MSNTLYTKGREGFLAGDLDFDANTIKITLVSTASYTANTSNDTFYTVIPIGGRVKESDTNALSTKTTTSGIADAGDVTLSAVSGIPFHAIVIWQDSGSPSTSRLIAYIDTGTGLPASPNSGDITVQWAAGTSKIFCL